VLLSIREFKDRVSDDMQGLVTELQEVTGRFGNEEARAWATSLPKVATIFSSPGFDPLHLYFGSRGSVSLEYQLPASSSWCDIVLLGQHQGRPAAAILELKEWVTRGDQPGGVEGLVLHQGKRMLHPSEQVRGYTNYCKLFHSAVLDAGAVVHGCVIFTGDYFVDAYLQPPNDDLVRDFPCFSTAPDMLEHSLPDYFSTHLTEPAPDFAQTFEKGVYKQDRGFVRQIGEQILNAEETTFELLDNQRFAFAFSRECVNEALFAHGGAGTRKTVILIEGPPGSGKSVVAARLWASLVTDRRLPDGSVVVTTTSMSQNRNWSYLFRQAADDYAKGVVKKATKYAPITTHKLGQLRHEYGRDFLADAESWADNVMLLRSLGIEFQDGALDNQYLVSVVDEAHALINPEHPEGRGQFGFPPTLGPQAFHIIRSSVVSIFLMDSEQGYRDRENTTREEIRAWANMLGAEIIEEVSLAGAQFRCAGSKEYVDWVEQVLSGYPVGQNCGLSIAWRNFEPQADRVRDGAVPVYGGLGQNPNRLQRMRFKICDSPADMETELRSRLEDGASARLLSSYSREWKTRDAASPHALSPEMMDFHVPYEDGGVQRYWSKVWNYVPNGDYTLFVQSRAGSPMHEDPLCEIGCPYAVRGFDFDYVGILWMGDLVWRGDRWIADPLSNFETGIMGAINKTRKENDVTGPMHARLLKAVTQSYRILLTRAMKGVYLWVEDEETREYLLNSLCQ